MLAVAMGETEVQECIDEVCKKFETRDLFIGCINSPVSVTLTGGRPQVEAFLKLMNQKGVFARKLKVSVAYHSPHMQTIAADYYASVGELGSRPPASDQETTMISSVTGLEVDQEELRSTEYWVTNSLSAVRFSDAIKTLFESEHKALGVTTLVELGPHSTLQGPIKDTLKEVSQGSKIEYFSCLQRNNPADKTFLSALGRLHCQGFAVNLRLINQTVAKSANHPSVLSNLPEYQFNHSKTYWHEGRLSMGSRFRKNARLDLLGKPVIDWNSHEAKWRNFVRFSEVPWVKAHKISDTCIYPAAGMLVMAIEAANQVADPARDISGFRLTDVHVLSSLRVPDTQEGVETQFTLHSLKSDGDKSSQAFQFRLYTCENGNWVKKCEGNIRVEYSPTSPGFDFTNETRKEFASQQHLLKKTLSSCGETLSREYFYTWLWNVGLHLGDEFRVLRDIQSNDDGEAVADLDYFVWPASEAQNRSQLHVIHPITLDGIAQSAMAAFSCGTKVQYPTAVPNGIKMLWVSKHGLSAPASSSLKLRASTTSSHRLGFESSIVAFNEANDRVVLRLEGLNCRFVTGAASTVLTCTKQTSLNMSWMPDVDLLSAEQLRNSGDSQNMPKLTNGHLKEFTRKELYSAIGNYIGLTAFKDPGLKILQANSLEEMELQSLVRHHLNWKGSECPWAQWLVTSNPESSAEAASWEATETSIQSLNIGQDLARQGFDQTDFDMLLVNLVRAEFPFVSCFANSFQIPSSAAHFAAVLNNAARLLKP